MSIVAITLGLLLAPNFQEKPSPLLGFSAETAAVERKLEYRFDSHLEAPNLRDWMQRLSLRPHHVGSPYGLDNARYLKHLYESFGFTAKIETFNVLFPSPKTRILSIGEYHARLTEPGVANDSSSRFGNEALPPYNAYSIDGDVLAPAVYVNYGMPADYDELRKYGVDVRGKIVIARYGGGWRGIKPKVAAEHGAVGCIIYSDPKDDGYVQGDVYPVGGWRSNRSVQRGSVADMPLFPGDPLTPGVGATKGAKRLKIEEAPTITKIPTLPISYGDASPILKDLAGQVVPAEWRGGLPLTYHVGPTNQLVHLKVASNWNIVEARDVIATLAGSELPNEWVIRGNHHDAWVCGADDPLSGQVAMLEEAKCIGELAKTGWKPRRTIIYCSWDGEEPGLLGSTEWVETHEDILREKAVAYINSDSNGRGFLGMGGSHCLEPFINEVARDVPDSETNLSADGRLRARDLVSGTAEAKKRAKTTEDRPIDPLGSGSDFSPFLQHIGVASLDLGYGGEGDGTQYHSAYDTFEWFVRFVDPDFTYGTQLAKTAGRAVLRLANADQIPMNYMPFATTVEKYVKEIIELNKKLHDEADELNRNLADGTLAATMDPSKKMVLPKKKPVVPIIDFEPLLKAVAQLKATLKSAHPDNYKLIQAERNLLGPGLPRRSWYRHTIYAPGFYTGYGVKTLPGIREALEQGNWSEAEAQAKIVVDALGRLSKTLQ
jgi:N-acetylated-alpha-linked acidic dipeptidase